MTTITKPARIIVLGMGNLLLRDEGIGVHVANALQGVPAPDNVSLEVIDGGTLPDTPPECDCFDRDPAGGDGDVDIDDFTAFETCWSGPTVPANPACDD